MCGSGLWSVQRWFAAGLLVLPNHCRPTARVESHATTTVPVTAPAGATQRMQRLRASDRPLETFAHPIPVRALAQAPWAHVHLGDGWGCGQHQDLSWECWSAARRPSSGSAIVAQRVPWLDGKSLSLGPDRLCVDEGTQVRCWRAPEILEREQNATSLPDPSESWLLPHQPDPDGEFLRDATPVTHGAAVGCAHGFCWGAASALQPGPVCEFGGIRLPCALADEATLREFSRGGGYDERLIVGDLFACKLITEKGLFCLGASRDGFFGSASACPPELSSSWPGSSGPSPAPHAACARSPVLLRAGDYSGVFGSASPSGFCLWQRVDGDWVPVCFGGITVPHSGFEEISVGLSERPSACGIDKRGRLYCWGVGYSADAAGKVPIRVLRGPAQPSVAWDDQGRFHRTCMIQSPCGRAVRALPACPPESDALTPSAVLALADGFEHQRVSVRGNLGLTPVRWQGQAAIACGPFRGPADPIEELGGGTDQFCCPGAGDASVLVTNGQQNLILDGSWCHGDSSRTCCSLPVLGQAVIASGVLTWRERGNGLDEAWVLKDPELCALEPARSQKVDGRRP